MFHYVGHMLAAIMLDKRQVMILTEVNQSTDILNKITMLCPGLVVLYDSNKESEETVPQVGPHTVLLRLERPLFTTTSPSLSQCLLTAHLTSSPRPPASLWIICTRSASDLSTLPPGH